MSASGHLGMGDGAEFDAIRRLLSAWGPLAKGIGDDAAILDVAAGERLVVSTDASIENVHFRREWLSAEEIGARATAAALSDLAAMAARPIGLLLALAIPESWRDELDALGRGVGRVASSVGCPIVGGNISAASELSLTLTVLGSAQQPLRRDAARVGDAIFVTGRLGGPGAALRAFARGAVPTAADRARFVAPSPRIVEARWLAERGASGAIDISDGLLADATHLATASAVTIELDADAVPRVHGVTMEDALSSGEEYELLVSVPRSAGIDVAEFERAFGIPLTRIGIVVDRGATPVMSSISQISMRGHDHLTRQP